MTDDSLKKSVWIFLLCLAFLKVVMLFATYRFARMPVLPRANTGHEPQVQEQIDTLQMEIEALWDYIHERQLACPIAEAA